MNAPLFLPDSNVRIPGRIRYKFNEDIYINEKMIPWLNCTIQAKSNSFDELYAIGIEEYPQWMDYYCIYGNDELLWQGILPATPEEIVPSDLSEFYVSHPIKQIPIIGNEWRAKYKDIQPGYYWALWKTDVFVKVFISGEWVWTTVPGTPIIGYKVSEEKFSFNFPDENSDFTRGMIPDYPPIPPDYPPEPTYSTIKMTRNNPEPEASTEVTGINASSYTQSIIKIGDNKFKIFVKGEIYYYGKDIPFDMSFQTVEGTWKAEKWDDIVWDGPWWTWSRGWRYKLVSASGSGTTSKRSRYLTSDGNIDLKLKIAVQNPGGFI